MTLLFFSLLTQVFATQFTDRDLQRTLRDSCSGSHRCIFYLWSPHMPLSVPGRESVVRFAKKKSIRLFTLLDAHANRALAEHVRRENHWPDDTLVMQSSRAIDDLGALIHFPSYVLARAGRVVGPLIPGAQGDKDLAYLEARYLK